MKTLSIKQLVMLGLGVVAVVFVGTYARTLIGGSTPSSADKERGVRPTQLNFSSVVWPQETGDEAVPNYELNVTGKHAFWYTNDSGNPVQVALISKTCKCTKVEICTLPPALQGATPEELDRRAEDPALTWTTLEKEEEGRASTVPPHSAGGVRLHWKGETLGPKGLGADLRTESAGVAGDPIHLEARVNFVPGMRVTPEDDMTRPPEKTEVAVGDLEEGGSRSVNLICWSLTRDHFTLQVQPPDNPCGTAGKPEKLSQQECQRLGKGIRSGYRVPVTVSERTTDRRTGAIHQLDLGHFRLFYRFISPDEGLEPVTFDIAGMVRGDITVKGHDDRGRVVPDLVYLGSFERGDGASTDVTLTTERNGLDLEVESHPDFLKVELTEEKGADLIGKTWTMKVAVAPDTWVGPIPHGTDIVLKTKGDHPRRIRIPVTGIAFVR